MQATKTLRRALPLFIATCSVAVTSALLGGVATILDTASRHDEPLSAQTQHVAGQPEKSRTP
jgi:hypothetical protein